MKQVTPIVKNYSLGKIIGSGGEGNVFEIVGQPNQVAKVYKEQITANKAKKLAAMVAAKNSSLEKISAWPLELLFDQKNNVCGFVMPKVSGFKPIHELFNPAARKQNFPQADYAFLIQAARNTVAAIGVIHEGGFVIGDVNEGNILINQSAIVTLIDCDSFQVKNSDQVFRCEVGIPMYTAPELQSYKSFRDIDRKPIHDLFSVAVICFQLLFMGRHPFVGIYKGTDVTLDKAIERFWFSYGEAGKNKGISPPPESLNYNDLPASIKFLFDGAFTENGVASRPTAVHWVKSLDDLRHHLRICSKEKTHKYFDNQSQCPWCYLEEKKGIFFFLTTHRDSFNLSGFDLVNVWNKITAIDCPDEPEIDPRKIQVTKTPLPSELIFANAFASVQKYIGVILSIVLMFSYPNYSIWWILLGILIYNLPILKTRLSNEINARKTALRTAQLNWSSASSQWERDATSAGFVNKLNMLRETKRQYENLGSEFTAAKRRVFDDRASVQREEFLDKFLIKKNSIEGIGENRRSILASYGILTASDIGKLTSVKIPGFGDTLVFNLLNWRNMHAKQFKFDPNKPVSQDQLNKLNKEFENKKIRLQKMLLDGHDELQEIRRQIFSKRAVMRDRMAQYAKQYAQTLADTKI